MSLNLEVGKITVNQNNLDYQFDVAFSYAGEKRNYVEPIYQCLKNKDVKVFFDQAYEIDLWGKDLLKYFTDLFKNKARYCIMFISKEYVQKDWPKLEANSALERLMREHEDYILPVRFDDSNVPGLPSTIGYLNAERFSAKKLCEAIERKTKGETIDFEEQSRTDLLSKLEGADSKNPFSRVRAEQFQDDKLLAKAFAEPIASVYGTIKSPLPTMIIGGRGSGKTTILRSMTPEVILPRIAGESTADMLKNSIDYYGIYFKLQRGSLSISDPATISKLILLQGNQGFSKEDFVKVYEKIENGSYSDSFIKSGIDMCRSLTMQELNLKILKAILEHFDKINKEQYRFLSISYEEEKTVVDSILSEMGINDSKIDSFIGLIRKLNSELAKISVYLETMIYPQGKGGVPDWIPTRSNFLDEVFRTMRYLEDLKGMRFYLLFDEFENLLGFQQEIINEWIKTASFFVVKVASKHNGILSSNTIEGQTLQLGHDLHPISLDYDLTDISHFRKYKGFLKVLSENLLKISNFKSTDIEEILSDPDFIEIPDSEIRDEIKQMREDHKLEFKEENIKKYEEKAKISATFRLLNRSGKRKVYFGFDTFAYLSSGTIRTFLNLAGMAFYLAEEEEKIDVSKRFTIPAKTQGRAANYVSRTWLNRIPKQYSFGEAGEQIYTMIIDVGEFLRRKLLNNLSEPETLSFSIVNPVLLEEQRFSYLKTLTDESVKESILMERPESGTPLPKDPSKNRTKDFSLNRIYAPALRLSYRTRWRGLEVTVEELAGLIDQSIRDQVKKSIMERVSNTAKGAIKPNGFTLDSFPNW